MKLTPWLATPYPPGIVGTGAGGGTEIGTGGTFAGDTDVVDEPITDRYDNRARVV